MRKYILLTLAVICGWLAPSALADRLVSQEPRFIHRHHGRVFVEREFLPDYYTNDEIRTFRTTRVEDMDDDDDHHDAKDWDDDDDHGRVIIQRPHRVERRVIIRDRD